MHFTEYRITFLGCLTGTGLPALAKSDNLWPLYFSAEYLMLKEEHIIFTTKMYIIFTTKIYIFSSEKHQVAYL